MLDGLSGLARPSKPKSTALALPPRETASCDEAWRYETSTATANAVWCSRRAGKTIAGGRRAVRVLLSEPGAIVQICSLIRLNARKHFWRPICALLDKLGVEYEANETQMLLRIPANGSQLQCYGVDDVGGTKAVQGDRSSLFIIDECHLPNDNVLNLLITIAEPMLIDTGGMLDLLGLPPDVEPCTFSYALDNPEWKTFHWDMFAHDLPDTRAKKRARVERIIKNKGLSWDHPIIRRQYLGERVRDPASQAYEYQAGRNDYAPRSVDFSRPGWLHAVGLDLGFQDRDAIVVLAWRMDDPQRRVYVRFIWQRNHLSTDSLAYVVGLVAAVYRPVAWTGDTGGHGAVKVLQTLMQRLRIAIDPKPPDVLVSLGYVNDDLRTGRLLLPTEDVETARLQATAAKMYAGRPTELAEVRGLLADSWAPAGAELARVPKLVKPTTLKVTINPKGPNHSDVSEALRYAHAGALNWLATAPAQVKQLTPEEREAQQDEDEQEESARDGNRTWYQRQAARARR
jgi:hypothetical protein